MRLTPEIARLNHVMESRALAHVADALSKHPAIAQLSPDSVIKGAAKMHGVPGHVAAHIVKRTLDNPVHNLGSDQVKLPPHVDHTDPMSVVQNVSHLLKHSDATPTHGIYDTSHDTIRAYHAIGAGHSVEDAQKAHPMADFENGHHVADVHKRISAMHASSDSRAQLSKYVSAVHAEHSEDDSLPSGFHSEWAASVHRYNPGRYHGVQPWDSVYAND